MSTLCHVRMSSELVAATVRCRFIDAIIQIMDANEIRTCAQMANYKFADVVFANDVTGMPHAFRKLRWCSACFRQCRWQARLHAWCIQEVPQGEEAAGCRRG